MPPRSSPYFLTVFLLLLDIAVQNYSQSALFPIVTICSGLMFKSPSPYETKLHRLIADLIASTPNNPSYFSVTNSTISPQVIVLAQCRPDLSPALCAACLNQSAATIYTVSLGCGMLKSGSIRSENCLLRYTDVMFLNDPNEDMPNIVTAPDASASFNRRAQDLMNTLIAKTAEAELRFAVGVSNESADAVDIYGMGWCSIDLMSSDCAHCLRFLLERIAGKQRGVATIVSCQVRFETYPFFASSFIATASAPAEAEVVSKPME
ncbi:putative cysteine-rich repeat secretory protein 35 [Platanthera guangdongensis]|uniref:Cysteine-rich repeat secretory protein 35 n=1 Tax=Platanthera guangdongensis TaxID=2320717 RepID=A0ABR2MDC4_9ASPA